MTRLVMLPVMAPPPNPLNVAVRLPIETICWLEPAPGEYVIFTSCATAVITVLIFRVNIPNLTAKAPEDKLN